MRRRIAVLAVAAPLLLPVALFVVVALVVLAVGSGGSVSSANAPSGGVTGSQLRADVPVPPEYLALIRGAVGRADIGCPELTESVLAAQLRQESGFNPRALSPVGAEGIAQFMPGTWRVYGKDEDGDQQASPWNPSDAIPAATRYDCAIARAVQQARLPGDPAALMLAGYNAGTAAVLGYQGVPPYEETQNYVRTILSTATEWGTSPGVIGVGLGPGGRPSGGAVELTGNAIVDTAVAWAAGQVGSWYHYGGSCTDPFSPVQARRCDCSSLLQQAYAHAGVALPRTAAEQSRVGAPVFPGEIQPGDLVVTIGSDGTLARPGHIAMYVGSGLVVEAPYEGVQVHFLPVRAYPDVVAIRRVVTG